MSTTSWLMVVCAMATGACGRDAEGKMPELAERRLGFSRQGIHTTLRLPNNAKLDAEPTHGAVPIGPTPTTPWAAAAGEIVAADRIVITVPGFPGLQIDVNPVPPSTSLESQQAFYGKISTSSSSGKATSPGVKRADALADGWAMTVKRSETSFTVHRMLFAQERPVAVMCTAHMTSASAPRQFGLLESICDSIAIVN